MKKLSTEEEIARLKKAMETKANKFNKEYEAFKDDDLDFAKYIEGIKKSGRDKE